MLYISSINDEMLNRTKDAETYFNYKYGWSFAFAAISFLLTEVTCPIVPCARLILPHLEGRREPSLSTLDHLPTLPLFPRMYLSLAFLGLFYPGGSQGPLLSTHALTLPAERVHDCVPGRHSWDITRRHPQPPSVSSLLFLFHCRVLE